MVMLKKMKINHHKHYSMKNNVEFLMLLIENTFNIYLKILKVFCVRVNNEFEMNSMSLSFFYK